MGLGFRVQHLGFRVQGGWRLLQHARPCGYDWGYKKEVGKLRLELPGTEEPNYFCTNNPSINQIRVEVHST